MVIWCQTYGKGPLKILREETCCHHMDCSFRLPARILLCASSHIQDNTYHRLCYTSRGALAGTREWFRRCFLVFIFNNTFLFFSLSGCPIAAMGKLISAQNNKKGKTSSQLEFLLQILILTLFFNE